jgi:hypothetical protein
MIIHTAKSYPQGSRLVPSFWNGSLDSTMAGTCGEEQLAVGIAPGGPPST